MTHTRGRLPGVRFEAQPRAARDALPRMDVAVFVGFAAAGPVNRPVAVESDAQFADVFGADAPLVWDGRRGERVRAYLAAAVRAFFRNGGLRCWVVRVAGGAARHNYLPVPGLVRLREDGTLAPAYARARARGSWSDALRAGASLSTLPVAATRFAAQTPGDFDLELSGRGDVAAGDLLRFTFGEEGYVLFVVVGSVTAPEVASPPSDAAAQRRTRVRVAASVARWFKLPAPPSGSDEGEAVVYAPDARRRVRASVPDGVVWGKDEEVALDLELAAEAAPPPGTFVRADFAGEQLWLLVREASVADGAASPPGSAVRAKGQAVYFLKDDAPPPAPAGTPFVERLRFELSVARGTSDAVRLGDLAFAPDHARFWGALPTDEEFFGDTLTPFEARDPQTRALRADFETKYASLWREVSSPRFPLAGRRALDAGGAYFPLLMPALSDAFLRPVALPATALERDGLARFDETLFLDPQLLAADTETLLSQADYIRYQSPTPRRLKGIHAALEIEEATIISVPDEVHTGWERRPRERVEAGASEPVPHPEWWHALSCSPPPASPPRATEPPRANFLGCDLHFFANKPTLTKDEPDPSGTFTLRWDVEGAVENETSYVLEEATDPGWTDSVRIYEGAGTRLTLYGRAAGYYFYRVRAVVGRSSSEWSKGEAVAVLPPGEWRARQAEDYFADTLLGVQRALLRACAARGDLFAVLSLPSHYREDDAQAHAAALGMQIRPTTDVRKLSAAVPPLNSAERRALSYGALYHPWLAAREESALAELRVTPPAGAACGVMAARAVTRGAWVAPANEPLRGVVALAPALLRRRLLDLQDAGVNVIRNEPRGFLLLDADTLSDDPDLRQINVRRLLSLLRRLAQRLGATYVFEPNDDSFRRLVERGFEQMLGQMFERGAFAGATPAAAYRVNAGSPPNTRPGSDQGRFIVELSVAPSRPLAFLTIRMLRTGDGEVAVEER